ncbi:hypothetical protein R1sor_000157 [Riccia sorocarpa]|uniref:FCP1 homology domain-containing protein n=1 Tax=Riccia sorocarpa TaxID=122646 RepID=A0ABD3GVJ7_9MARC
MARTRGEGVVRRRPGRPRGAGAGAAAAAGRGRNVAPAGRGRNAALGGVRPRAAPVAAPARNVRPRRGVPDPPESSGSERGDSADETEAEVDEAEAEVEEAESEPEEIEGGCRRPRRRNRKHQEGDSLVPIHFTPDAELSVKWGWVLTEEIQPIVDVISDQDIVKLNFVSFFGQQYQQPHFAVCLEFIRTYDIDTHTGTVGGTAVTLSRQLVRDAFGLRYGMKPMDMKIRHTKIEDWFPVRDEKGKRYFARECARGMGWAAFLQLVGMVLLPRRRVKCIPVHLIFYVRTKIEGSVEEDYDLTAFTLEMLRHEIVQVRLHLDWTRHQRYLITFLGIPLTTILAHARVIDPAETITQPQPVPTREAVQEAVIRQRVIQDLGASSSQTAEELQQQVTELEARQANLQETIARMSSVEDPRPRLVAPESIRGKVLILDLNGLLVRYCTQEQADSARLFDHQPVQLPSRSWYVPRVGLITFLEAVRREFTLIFWTSRMKHNADALLRDLEERGLIPARFFLTEPEVEVWAQSECDRWETPRESEHGGVLYLKRFARLYYYNLASRDVLLVDDFVKKNSTNTVRFTPIPLLHGERIMLHTGISSCGGLFYLGCRLGGSPRSRLRLTYVDRAIARSLFIEDVPVAEASVAVAGVDDVPVAATTIADVPVASAGVDVIPVAIPIVHDSHMV